MSDLQKLEIQNARLTEIIVSILECPDLSIPVNLLKRAQGVVKIKHQNKNRPLTEDDVELVRTMRAEGRKPAEIALAMGRSYNAVAHVVFKNKMPKAVLHHPAHINQKHIDDALVLRANGYTWKECGKALGRHWQCLGRACREYDKEASKAGKTN